MWKSALLHKCEILEDLHQRLVPEVERGQVGDHLPIYVMTCNNVAFHHSQCSHSLAPIWEWCPFSLPLTPLSSTPLRSFSEPGDGRFLTKCPSWMQWMLHAKTSQLNTARVDKAYQKTPCQRRRYQVWCGWEHVAKCRRLGRLEDYFIYMLLYCSVDFSVCMFCTFI